MPTRQLLALAAAAFAAALAPHSLRAQAPPGEPPQPGPVALEAPATLADAAATSGTERPPELALREIDLGLPTAPVTLRDATASALQRNTQLAVSRLDPPIARERILSAKGAFDAILTAGFDFNRDKSQTSVHFSPWAVNRRTGARMGLSKRWFTGTETSIDAAMDRANPDGPGVDHSSSVTFSVRQNLLRGLRPAANLAAIHQAENTFKRSLYGLRSDAIATVSNVETAYWNLALAYELLRVQQFSHDLAVGQLERTRAFVEVGKLASLDLTTSEAEVASRQRDFINAKNNLEKTAIEFLFLTQAAFDESGQYTLPRPIDQAALPPLPGSDAESLKLAMQTRPDLFQAHLDLENGELDVVRTADGLLPRLDLVGSYGLTGRGKSDDDARRRLRGADFDQYSVGIELEAPLPNRRARGDWRAAKLSREQLELSIENLRQRIRADVLKARVDLENLLAAADAARVSVELQERKLVNEQEKWKNGLSTNLDVIQAQRDLVQARNQLVISIADALKSETNLFVQEGTLLEVRGLAAEGGEELK